MIDAGVNVTEFGNSSTSARASAYAFGASVIKDTGHGNESGRNYIDFDGPRVYTTT